MFMRKKSGKELIEVSGREVQKGRNAIRSTELRSAQSWRARRHLGRRGVLVKAGKEPLSSDEMLLQVQIQLDGRLALPG